MSKFDLNAILRGAQLTFVGAHRALQNPQLFTSDHYRQAATAVGAGIIVRLFIEAPIIFVKALVWGTSIFVDLDAITWDDKLEHGIRFVAFQVLQLPFFFMMLMRYITPTLDNLFMDSLQWVDITYVQKHEKDDPRILRAMYCTNLKMYPRHGTKAPRKSPVEAISTALSRFSRRAIISLAVFALSHVPILGKFVLPAASFYTFRKAVGTFPAGIIFGCGILLPKRYLVVFLQSYFASRKLMRELLEPYFSRIPFTQSQKGRFFRDREGVLFGFGFGFYILLKIPLLGVLVYGIAEASTAYLITKITDPPPPPAYSENFAETQTKWTNKYDFLSLSITNMDVYNVPNTATNPSLQTGRSKGFETSQKKFS